MPHTIWAPIAIAVMLAAAPLAAQEKASGTFVTADGKNVGTVTVEQKDGGTLMILALHDLPPGVRAMHIHAVGTCTPPGFESAGPHWNPAGHQHGKDNPKGKHAGDLDNITVPAGGKLDLQIPLPGVRLTGDGGMLDADGAAVVIHAGPDDYKTDPAGNAGARIACAALVAGK